MNEIEKERRYQDEKWGREMDDTVNKPNDWVAYIARYSTGWFAGQFPPYDKEVVDSFRESMVKTGALALAAIESLDRQRQENGQAFYEKESYD